MPNLFLPGPTERKTERKKGGKRKKDGQNSKESATVHPDSLTGNAERFWPLVVTAGWTSTDKTRGGREK